MNLKYIAVVKQPDHTPSTLSVPPVLLIFNDGQSEADDLVGSHNVR